METIDETRALIPLAGVTVIDAEVVTEVIPFRMPIHAASLSVAPGYSALHV